MTEWIPIIIDVLRVLGAAIGATFVWYPSAVLIGGGGIAGEEDIMITQMAVGFLLLFVVFFPW